MSRAVESRMLGSFSYVAEFLCFGWDVGAALAGFLRDDVCAFEFSAGTADERLAMEDAFAVFAADRFALDAGGVDVASF